MKFATRTTQSATGLEDFAMSIIREIYEGFQRGELERWDAIIAQDANRVDPIEIIEEHQS